MRHAQKTALTLEGAKHVAANAEAEAVKHDWRVVIAIVDDGGHLLYLQRSDDTQIGSVEVAIQKAQSALAFKRPTKTWEEAIAGGRVSVLGLPGVVPIEGGLPLIVGGRIVGAIGVSGVRSSEDGQIAKVGAEALA